MSHLRRSPRLLATLGAAAALAVTVLAPRSEATATDTATEARTASSVGARALPDRAATAVAITERARAAAALAPADPAPDVEVRAAAADASDAPIEPAPTPSPRPAPEPADDHAIWDALAMCESSGNWSSTVGLYEGGLQFHPRTWDAFKPAGFPEAAYEASREQQILVAERVLAVQGWGAWPVCSYEIGAR